MIIVIIPHFSYIEKIYLVGILAKFCFSFGNFVLNGEIVVY